MKKTYIAPQSITIEVEEIELLADSDPLSGLSIEEDNTTAPTDANVKGSIWDMW